MFEEWSVSWAGIAWDLTYGGARHEDLLLRTEDLFPYPVARNVRSLRLAKDPRVQYEEILNPSKVCSCTSERSVLYGPESTGS